MHLKVVNSTNINDPLTISEFPAIPTTDKKQQQIAGKHRFPAAAEENGYLTGCDCRGERADRSSVQQGAL